MQSRLTGANYRYAIEIMVIGVLLSIGIIWVAPGPLFTLIMRDYGIDRAMVGLTTSIVSLVMAVSCILSGILANRLGLKKTFAIGAFLWPIPVEPYRVKIVSAGLMFYVLAQLIGRG